MKFIDVAKIKLFVGKGGDRVVVFHRELYVPKGGPSESDGGSIIFVGENGTVKNMHGKKSLNI